MYKLISLFLFFVSVNSVVYGAQITQNRYIFDSDEEVRQYFFKGERTYASTKSFPNQYKSLNKAIDEVFGHITKLSGNNDLKRPIVLIGKNIGDLSINIQGMTSNAIILRLETVNDINHLYGVLAHEMAHYFLDHGVLSDEEEILVSYDSKSTDCINCLDERDQNTIVDPNLILLYNKWSSISAFINPEFLNLPISPYDSKKSLSKLLENLILPLKKSSLMNNISCKIAYNDYVELFNESVRNINKINQALSFSERDKKKIERYASEFKEYASKCFESRDELFNLAYEKTYGVSILELKNFLKTNPSIDNQTLEGLEILVSDINPISKIETLTKLTSLEIERITSSLSLSGNIRYLSQEDQADEMAIKVLSHTKYPNALSHFFLSNASDEEVKQCKEIVDIQGKEPSFGRFSDTHHSNCWRYWRSQKVMKHIIK